MPHLEVLKPLYYPILSYSTTMHCSISVVQYFSANTIAVLEIEALSYNSTLHCIIAMVLHDMSANIMAILEIDACLIWKF